MKHTEQILEQIMIVGGLSGQYHVKTEMMDLNEGWKIVADYPFKRKIRVGALG